MGDEKSLGNMVSDVGPLLDIRFAKSKMLNLDQVQFINHAFYSLYFRVQLPWATEIFLLCVLVEVSYFNDSF